MILCVMYYNIMYARVRDMETDNENNNTRMARRPAVRGSGYCTFRIVYSTIYT